MSVTSHSQHGFGCPHASVFQHFRADLLTRVGAQHPPAALQHGELCPAMFICTSLCVSNVLAWTHIANRNERSHGRDEGRRARFRRQRSVDRRRPHRREVSTSRSSSSGQRTSRRCGPPASPSRCQRGRFTSNREPCTCARWRRSRSLFDVVLLLMKAYDTRWACQLIEPYLAPAEWLPACRTACRPTPSPRSSELIALWAPSSRSRPRCTNPAWCNGTRGPHDPGSPSAPSMPSARHHEQAVAGLLSHSGTVAESTTSGRPSG